MKGVVGLLLWNEPGGAVRERGVLRITIGSSFADKSCETGSDGAKLTVAEGLAVRCPLSSSDVTAAVSPPTKRLKAFSRLVG